MFLDRQTDALFDARLQRRIAAPLIVALSGGGDSLALLLMAHAWAAGAGRRLIAATVDHRLQPDGADWAAWCAARCAALGVAHHTLAWTGPKPTTGLPAAARAARHALIADLARAQGAGVILMAHTADDLIEARAMRQAGSTTPSPRDWSPSPAWPAGRGVFLHRPLLGVRRADLRAWLTARGETWIEDPANTDPRFARARARAALSSAVPVVDTGVSAEAARAGQWGCFPRPDDTGDGSLVFAAGAFAGAPRALAAAVLCASGGARPPRRDVIERLLARLDAGEAFSANVGGSRIMSANDRIVIAREPGEYRRKSENVVPLAPGVPTVWDGRFELETTLPGLAVLRLQGLFPRLSPNEFKALSRLPAAIRPTLPALVDKAGAVTCPILAHPPQTRAHPLAHQRFLAAVGAICDEETLWRVAKAVRTS